MKKIFAALFFASIYICFSVSACTTNISNTIALPDVLSAECGEGGSDMNPDASASSSTGMAPECVTCSEAFSGADLNTLCPESAERFVAYVTCVCDSVCAPVCSFATPPGPELADTWQCLGQWDGNEPTQCKLCMGSQTGCGALLNDCLADDGLPSTLSPAVEPECLCPPGMPLCPGHSWECTAPGTFSNELGGVCGSASYCAPCCDAQDECSVRGTCSVTKIASVPCVEDYECCSGVCTDGACVGGCGVPFGSGG